MGGRNLKNFLKYEEGVKGIWKGQISGKVNKSTGFQDIYFFNTTRGGNLTLYYRADANSKTDNPDAYISILFNGKIVNEDIDPSQGNSTNRCAFNPGEHSIIIRACSKIKENKMGDKSSETYKFQISISELLADSLK
ncbi:MULTISPECIES: hypothetical protein [unclassified Methylobacterium]|uniref:hypothetical protein n=1 Tax=unclassified Methylobacterium TaxID=2615210 RepID=UPI00226AA947|nr:MULTISPECIES: hypothetical protein [unclassified Methylobacterium]